MDIKRRIACFTKIKIAQELKSRMPSDEDMDTSILYAVHVMQITVLKETLTLYWL